LSLTQKLGKRGRFAKVSGINHEGINRWCKSIAGKNTNFKTRELNA